MGKTVDAIIRSRIAACSAVVLLASAAVRHAGTVTKKNNNTLLNNKSSWTGGTVPGVVDIAVCDSTVNGATKSAIGGSLSWLGIRITNPGGLVTINATLGRTLTLGTGGIELSTATLRAFFARCVPANFCCKSSRGDNVIPVNNRQRLAVLGLVLVLPAFLAVASGLLRFSVPGALISPVLVLPGLVGAFLVSAIGILRVRRERELSGSLAAITIRIEARLLNLAVAALSLLLTAVLAGYLFVENFHSH